MEDDRPADPPPRGTLLAIEDDPISMELLAGMLEAAPQVRLLRAFDAAEGIRLAREAAPDLVLLDMHLPGGSGLDVVRALNEPIAAQRFDVVLLTGDALTMDVIKAMSLGAREYWTKPVRYERLLAALARAVARRPPL
ncbi:MAG: response regulator, partial [Piscinibacter sp.]|nr:response regulator [Piscinibacter sp.]